MFKKSLIFAIMMVLGSGGFASAGCTAEEFQKEVMAMQASMQELAKDSDKLAKVNAEFEKEFSAEILEFSQMAQGAASDPSKGQAMLDKGCDLYGRMNKKLNEYK